MRSQQPADVVVVGAGAAGLAAAIEAASSGGRTRLLARAQPGGATAALARVESVPGCPVGLSGPEYVTRALALAERLGVEVATGDPATGLSHSRDGFVVHTQSGRLHAARHVIAATGVARQIPVIPGVADLLGAGVHVTLPAEPPHRLPWPQAVVAGDDALVSAAVAQLTTRCPRVVVVTPHVRASGAWRRPRRSGGHVTVLHASEVVCAAGIIRLESVVVRHRHTGQISAFEASALLLLEPVTPRSAWLPSDVGRDAHGFVLTGMEAARSMAPGDARAPEVTETGVRGLFAVGELRRNGMGGAAALVDAISAARLARPPDGFTPSI